MTTTIDITDVSDNVLDCFLASKTDEVVDCEHLTRTERYQLADLMGWDLNNYSVSNWCRGGKVENNIKTNTDYEGIILENQEDESWGN